MRFIQRKSRKAYILAAVLGMTAVVTAMGISYLESASTVMPESINRYGSMKALYMAESGVAIGSRFLMMPPTSVAVNNYWTGATGLAADTTNDRVDVAITQPNSGDPNYYRIVSSGIAYGPVGESRGKRSITSDVIVPPNGKWYFTHASIGTAATYTVSTKTTINGNFHGNGAVTGLGSCNGAVTASLTALWTGGGPPTSVTSLAPTVSVPSVTVSKYQNYTIQGRSYTAYSYNDNKITASDAATLNAIVMSATNPGRIIIVKNGDFELRSGATLTGTLVISGNFKVKESGLHRVTSVAQFPALVVDGDIRFEDDNATLDVSGIVICNGKVNGNGKDNAVTTIAGTGVFKNGANINGSGGSLTLTYSGTRAYMWDFDNAPATKPITVLSWKED